MSISIGTSISMHIGISSVIYQNSLDISISIDNDNVISLRYTYNYVSVLVSV